MNKPSPSWVIIIGLALIKFILPFFLQSPVYELQRDEYLYYQQGLHFDLGYMENPPLISYLGMVSSWLGGSVFWIKFWPCLFGAATLITTCLITAELGGKKFAQFLAGLCLFTGAYMRVHFLFQPNFLDIFFWTLAVYFLIRYINDNRSIFLYVFVISLALGFWSKYSVVFFAAALVMALLLSKYRKIFLEKKFYISAVIGLFIIIPNVWWQYDHNWPLIHHMEELQETQLKHLNPSDFVKDQFMMLLPAVLIWSGGLIWVLRQSTFRFIGLAWLFVVILLMFGRGKSYYTLGAYPMLLAAGAVAWEIWSKRMKWIRYVMPALVIVFTALIVPLLLPVYPPAELAAFNKRNDFKHKWEDLKEHDLSQDFADMLGWKELTVKTENFFNTLPDSEKSNTIIYGSNYGQAGSLKFYGKDDYFKNKVISSNGSFLLWIPDRLYMKNLIFIDDEIPEGARELFAHFQKMTTVDSVTYPLSRQLGDKIFFLENIDSTGMRIINEIFGKNKQQFNR
jgi:hypothetical protein